MVEHAASLIDGTLGNLTGDEDGKTSGDGGGCPHCLRGCVA